MFVQFVTKPFLDPIILKRIERFTQENNQTLLLPRLLFQRRRTRKIVTSENGCSNYIKANRQIYTNFVYAKLHIVNIS